MAEIVFGSVPGVTEGNWFLDRKALRAAGIHRPLMDGIDGNATEGASSIVLNGGYVDDEDLGNEIIYTGHGGNDPNTKKQIKNQSWESKGNKGLLISELKGLPVRVTRGSSHKSPFSPKSGYQYGGLYVVTHHFEATGKDGYRICRYRLEKAGADTSNTLDQAGIQLPEGKQTSGRTRITTLRIIRDTALSRSIKELYNYTCQICDIRIAVRGVPYAEAAHIKPLGKPHHGPDVPGNVICLCPNHHVMLDKGGFTIFSDLTLIGLEGRLKLHKDHRIGMEYLAYHQDYIFIND